ncbi:MAG: alpha/beta hydrolase [Pseudomonadota bacterium]
MRTALTAAAAILFTGSTAIAEIKMQTLTFDNEGSKLSGTLYLPENYSGKPLPIVVVTGAWTSVEEQMPQVYAKEMVKRGFAAFTFDFRGWGKSGDLPKSIRYKEDPAAKTSDIRAAFRFVSTLSQVDRANIHGLGICASSGYMVDAVAGNRLVNRIGLVAPWLQNKSIVETVYGGANGVKSLIEVGQAAAAKGGEIIPAAGPKDAQGVLMPIGGYYYDPARGAIPAYDNKWNLASWKGWLTYYPADNPQRLDKPLAIVHSEAAAIPKGVKTFLENWTGKATVKWLDNVTQFDFYDNPKDVERAADTVAKHFKAH